MPAFHTWQHLVANIKNMFEKKPTTAKTIPFNTKVTHRRLRIPDKNDQAGYNEKQRSPEGALVD